MYALKFHFRLNRGMHYTTAAAAPPGREDLHIIDRRIPDPEAIYSVRRSSRGPFDRSTRGRACIVCGRRLSGGGDGGNGRRVVEGEMGGGG